MGITSHLHPCISLMPPVGADCDLGRGGVLLKPLEKLLDPLPTPLLCAQLCPGGQELSSLPWAEDLPMPFCTGHCLSPSSLWTLLPIRGLCTSVQCMYILPMSTRGSVDMSVFLVG